MKISFYILLILSISSCSIHRYNQDLLFEWSEIQSPNRSKKINEKGRNLVNKLELFEKRNTSKTEEFTVGYYLKDKNGKVNKLDFETDGKSEILYFEFYNDFLFVLINEAGFVDRVHLYNINVKTGENAYYSKGQLPCKTDFEFNWKVGNSNCEWLNFNDAKVATIGMNKDLEPILRVYDWRKNELCILSTKLDIELNSNTGFIVNDNIEYNTNKNKFEKGKDH